MVTKAYTVRYLDKSSNEEIATAKVVENQTFEDEILTSNEIVSIDGYTYNSTNVDKLIIGTNNTENVINIYYNKRNDLSYSVKYFDKDTNTQIQSPKVVNNQVFNTQIIASSEIKDINGYNFDHLNVDNLSIGTGQNVIIVYYSKVTGLSYKVNYLLLDSDENDSNNVKLAESKIGSNKTYKDEINPANEEKVIIGYKVAKYSSNPLVITTDESKNVLNIYYEKDESQTKDIHYTIQYYKDGNIVPADTENISSTIYILDKITFTPNVNKYEGYYYDSINTIIPDSIEDGNIINVFYTIKNDLSYKVNYLEKGTNVVIHEPLKVENITYNTVVNVNDVLIDIPGYNFAEADNSKITIGVNIELNVINVFYTKRTDLSYLVKYIDKETGEEIKNQKVVPQKLLGEVIDSKDEIINVDGYNYDSVEEDYLTIGASINEMKIYYTKRNDIEYTIEYYFDDVLDSNLTQNIKAIYLQKIDEYKKAQRKGYTLDKEESFPLTISYIQEDNIIKIFYKRIVVPIRITSIDRITGRIIDYYEIGSRYGDEYIVNEKDFEGYNYVGTPSDIVGLTDTEVIDVVFYYEPASEKPDNGNPNKIIPDKVTSNNVIRVQDTGLNVISYNIIIGVIFITIGMTVLIIYTSKDKKNKETKAKF